MTRRMLRSPAIGLMALSIVALMAATSWGDEIPVPETRDMGKARIERPLKTLITTSSSSSAGNRVSNAVRALSAARDVRKMVIENPTKFVIQRGSAPVAVTNPEAGNPTVEAGHVRWHPTFDAACEASSRSGKPVLLFQMMGRLDQQFC